jgi:hypothetical protein
MTFFLGTYSIYTNGFQIPHLKEKKNRVSSGFVWVTRVMGRPTGSPGFGRAIATACLLLNPDRSSYWIPSRLARLGLITLLIYSSVMNYDFNIFMGVMWAGLSLSKLIQISWWSLRSYTRIKLISPNALSQD